MEPGGLQGIDNEAEKGLLSSKQQTHPRTSLKSTQRKGGIWGLFGESTAKLFGARATGRQSRTRV